MLSPAKVAKEIGISYTPVREAMIQLATEGFLDQAPQGRIFVKSFGRDELVELFEFRRTLEGGAAELAAEKITPQQLAELRASFQEHREHLDRLAKRAWVVEKEETLVALRRVDIQFHLAVISAAGNPRIGKMVNDLHLLTRIFQRKIPQVAESPLKHVCRAYAYHRRVLKALEAGNGETARKWMTRHLRWAQNYHLALLDEQERETLTSNIEESLWG